MPAPTWVVGALRKQHRSPSRDSSLTGTGYVVPSLERLFSSARVVTVPRQNYWSHRQIEVTLVLKAVDPVPSAAYGSGRRGPGLVSGLLGEVGVGGRRQRRMERNAYKHEIMADVHSMLGSGQASTYRAAVDQERYGGKPGWHLVFRYTGSAALGFAGGSESGWATRP